MPRRLDLVGQCNAGGLHQTLDRLGAVAELIGQVAERAGECTPLDRRLDPVGVGDHERVVGRSGGIGPPVIGGLQPELRASPKSGALDVQPLVPEVELKAWIPHEIGIFLSEGRIDPNVAL